MMHAILMAVRMALAMHSCFVYHQSMDVARIAAAIGEPARARMLECLLDGHARTSTELAIVGQVTPSTASVHLKRLENERLVKVQVQGKHRYYSLLGPEDAPPLEALSVLAGGSGDQFIPRHPVRGPGASIAS